MLLGQNLRRRHERGLIASLHGEQHRRNGDHGFSRTHVALQQTIHRVICREIAPDFRDDFLLRPSEFEWKRVQKSVQQCTGSAVRLAGANRRISTSRCNQDLHRKKFREDQVLPGGIAFLPIIGEMNCANRVISFTANKIARHQCFQSGRRGWKLI